MVTTVTNNSPQAINTSLFSLQEEIDDLRRQISQMKTKDTTAESELSKRSVSSDVPDTSLDAIKQLIPDTATPENQLADKDFVNGEISSVKSELGGKADITHTHTKSQITDFPTSLKNPNALTVNGKTYDGSEAVDAGVQTVENGGTGATNAADGFNTLADGVRDSSTPQDDEKMLLKPTGTWYKTTCLDFWNYIKGKISSVLGLTKDNYGGKAARAGNADKVASAGVSGNWIAGRANAICKTTVAGEGTGWKAFASIKTSSGSIEIGNLAGENYIRIVYSSDDDVRTGNNNVTNIAYIKRHEVVLHQKLNAASAGIRIPIGAPSSPQDGDIWIER